MCDIRVNNRPTNDPAFPIAGVDYNTNGIEAWWNLNKGIMSPLYKTAFANNGWYFVALSTDYPNRKGSVSVYDFQQHVVGYQEADLGALVTSYKFIDTYHYLLGCFFGCDNINKGTFRGLIDRTVTNYDYVDTTIETMLLAYTYRDSDNPRYLFLFDELSGSTIYDRLYGGYATASNVRIIKSDISRIYGSFESSLSQVTDQAWGNTAFFDITFAMEIKFNMNEQCQYPRSIFTVFNNYNEIKVSLQFSAKNKLKVTSIWGNLETDIEGDYVDGGWNRIVFAFLHEKHPVPVVFITINDIIVVHSKVSTVSNSFVDRSATWYTTIGYCSKTPSIPSFIGGIDYFMWKRSFEYTFSIEFVKFVNQVDTLLGLSSSCIPNCETGINKEFCFSTHLKCKSGTSYFDWRRGQCLSSWSGTTKCSPNPLFQRSCQCNNYYWYDTYDARCESCSISYCYNCDGNPNYCKLCSPGYSYRGGNACISYCHSNCNTCFRANDYASCNTCNKGYYYYSSSCDSVCPKGYYGDSDTNTCVNCHTSCESCTGIERNCTKCATGYYLQPNFTKTLCEFPYFNCKTTCPIGYYRDNITRTCLPCHEACGSCNDATDVCPICKPNAFRLGSDRCLLECPDGYESDIVNKFCYQCHSTCKRCKGPNANQCVTCKNPTQYIRSGECKDCDPSCYECFDGSAYGCISCNEGYILKQGQCNAMQCPQGTYPFVKNLTCLACPETCTVCTSSTDCRDCKAGYLVQGTECVICERKRGFQTVNGQCEEICGDGFNLGVNECDDGNQIDGDGCSADCKLEAGWKCSGGGQNAADKCIVISSVDVKVTGNTPDTPAAIDLLFGKTVTFKGPATDALNIVKKITLETVSVFQLVKQNSRLYSLTFDQYTPLAKQESFIVRVKQANLLRDNKNEPVFFLPQEAEVDFTLALKPPQQEDTSGANAAAAAAATSTIITLAVSGSANLLWKLLDALQTTTFFALISVTYPSLLERIFDLMNFVNLSWLPNPVNLLSQWLGMSSEKEEDEEETLQSPEKFQKNDFEPLFLLNSGQILFLLGIFALLSKLFNRLKQKPDATYSKSLAQKINTNFLIKTGINTYILLCIGVLLQMIRMNFDSFLAGLSSIVAIPSLILLFSVPFIMYRFLSKNKTKINTSEFQDKYGSLTEEYSDRSYLSQNFIILTTLSKLMTALAIVLLYQSGAMQAMGLFLCKAFKVITVFKIKPYKSIKDYRMDLMNEGISALICIPIFILGLYDDIHPPIIDTCILGLMFLLLGINVAIALAEQFTVYGKLIRKCKERNKNKKSTNILKRFGQKPDKKAPLQIKYFTSAEKKANRSKYLSKVCSKRRETAIPKTKIRSPSPYISRANNYSN